jgi:hypothetical protein
MRGVGGDANPVRKSIDATRVGAGLEKAQAAINQATEALETIAGEAYDLHEDSEELVANLQKLEELTSDKKDAERTPCVAAAKIAYLFNKVKALDELEKSRGQKVITVSAWVAGKKDISSLTDLVGELRAIRDIMMVIRCRTTAKGQIIELIDEALKLFAPGQGSLVKVKEEDVLGLGSKSCFCS